MGFIARHPLCRRVSKVVINLFILSFRTPYRIAGQGVELVVFVREVI